MKYITAIIISFSLLFPLNAVASENPIGIVKTTSGKAFIIRNDRPIESRMGIDLFLHDSLKTGPDGAISVVFRDDTMISIGPDSELAVNDFRFSPAEGKLSFIAKLLKGTSAYVSGIIGKLSPQSVRFETPVANIGIRGTKFAVKLVDDEMSR